MTSFENVLAAALGLGWRGVRQGIATASGTPIFWVKLAFLALRAGRAGWAARGVAGR